MLNLPPNVSILVCRESVNIHKSFDGLIGLVRSTMQADPVSPTFFVFFNKARTRVKILYWDIDGFAIWYKRLEQGTFHLTPPKNNETAIRMTRTQLTMLLEGLEPQKIMQRKRFLKKSA